MTAALLVALAILQSPAAGGDTEVIRSAADVCSRYTTETIDLGEFVSRSQALGFVAGAPKSDGDTRLVAPRQAGGSYEIIAGQDLGKSERDCYVGVEQWSDSAPLEFLTTTGIRVQGLTPHPGSHGFFYMRGSEPVLVISAQSDDAPDMWPGLLFLEFAPYRIPEGTR